MFGAVRNKARLDIERFVLLLDRVLSRLHVYVLQRCSERCLFRATRTRPRTGTHCITWCRDPAELVVLRLRFVSSSSLFIIYVAQSVLDERAPVNQLR